MELKERAWKGFWTERFSERYPEPDLNEKQGKRVNSCAGTESRGPVQGEKLFVFEKIFVFEVERVQLGIRSQDLIEAIPSRNITPVPCAPPGMRGSMIYNQVIIGVLDLHTILGISDDQDSGNNWILVLRPLERQCGLLVDSLVGMRHAKDSQAMTEKGKKGGFGGSIFSAQVDLDGKRLAILDVDRLTGLEIYGNG